MNEPGWKPDPQGRHQFRYWDGNGWTDNVADNGIEATDPFAGDGAAAPSGDAPAMPPPASPSPAPPPAATAAPAPSAVSPTSSAGPPGDTAGMGSRIAAIAGLATVAVLVLGLVLWNAVRNNENANSNQETSDDTSEGQAAASNDQSDPERSSDDAPESDAPEGGGFGSFSGEFASDTEIVEFPFDVAEGHLYRITATSEIEAESACRIGIYVGLGAPLDYYDGDRDSLQSDLLTDDSALSDHEFDFLSDRPSADDNHEWIFSDSPEEVDYLLGEAQCAGAEQPLDVIAEMDTRFTFVVTPYSSEKASSYEVTIEDLGAV